MRGLALGCDGSSTRGRMDTLPHRAAAAVAPIRDRRAHRSQNIELWQGERPLSLNLPGRGAGLDSLCEAHQEIAVSTEEIIVRSEWAIAASQRLLDQLKTAKRWRP